MRRSLLCDPIFKGCTRPAMLFGIPLVPFVLVVALGLLAGIWLEMFLGGTAFLSSIALISPILALLRGITRSDDQRVAQMILRARLLRWPVARKYWGASSYAPCGRRLVR